MKVPLVSAATAIAIDQLSKFYILSILKLNEIGSIDILPSLIKFHLGWNTGINFGLLSSHSEATRWILIVLSLVIAGLILFWGVKNLSHWPEQALVGGLVGGACSNVIDRVIYGAVVDFINMTCCGINNPFVFNVADIAIVGGALGILIFSYFRSYRG